MFIIFALYIYAFTVSFALSLLLVPFFRWVAIRQKILAYPHEARLHSEPIPLLGGVGLVLSFYITIVVHYVIVICFPHSLANIIPGELLPFLHGILKTAIQLSVVLLCGIIIFFLGLLDDLKTIGPKRKIFFQILIGIILYYHNIRITLFFGDGIMSLCLTIFWIVAITNAFNLLDNIDGLSSGIAIIASIILLILCIQGQQLLVSLLLTILIGSLLGFLRYNYPPAKIFMGDAGSLFIGYILSVLTIMSTFYYDTSLSVIPFISPLLIFAVPIYDTLSVVIIRMRNNKSIFTGDKNHFSHRLLRLGMSTKETILVIYLVSLCLGISALTLSNTDLKSQIIVLIQSAGILSIIYLLERVKNKDH
ncbi:MAG: undecaprenyl/decaprenyl-phosphate alpha-N-acetylglucosaminyl 1-phosphate transferase [Candidatus Omnitrophica bacterium]|nr:undecaprenyl/decaprenyl-phosphate alpha-N-acetylglucosaminyl 1-phosphate transferase [Candidatus Omnitrophota bacterium]